MSRVTKHDRDKANAREKIYQYREKLGVHPVNVRHWAEPYPADRPEAARVRFLQIVAVGGAECYEALLKGLVLRPLNIRNEWLVSNGGYDPDAPGAEKYQLHLWIRPRRYDDLFGRQHTAQHCDAELHDGWSGHKVRANGRRDRKRKGRVIYRGRVSDCLDHAKQLFTVWESTRRLGGEPERLVLF